MIKYIGDIAETEEFLKGKQYKTVCNVKTA